MSTYYHYHIRPTNEIEGMVDALQEFLGEKIEVIDCIEIVTDNEAISGVVGTLFGAEPTVKHDFAQPAEAPAPKVTVTHVDGDPTNQALDNLAPEVTPAELQIVDRSILEAADRDAAEAPASAPAKKTRGPYKKRQKPENGNGNGHRPEEGALQAAQVFEAPAAAVAEQPAAVAVEARPGEVENLAELVKNQTLRWLIAGSGKEVESINHLVSGMKIKPGERLHHRTKGWFEVKASGDGIVIDRVEA